MSASDLRPEEIEFIRQLRETADMIEQQQLLVTRWEISQDNRGYSPTLTLNVCMTPILHMGDELPKFPFVTRPRIGHKP